jgi:hypothetical protein
MLDKKAVVAGQRVDAKRRAIQYFETKFQSDRYDDGVMIPMRRTSMITACPNFA